MALLPLNTSVLEVLAGCAELGNLSMEVSDYNISCRNRSVLPRAAIRGKGRMTYCFPHAAAAASAATLS